MKHAVKSIEGLVKFYTRECELDLNNISIPSGDNTGGWASDAEIVWLKLVQWMLTDEQFGVLNLPKDRVDCLSALQLIQGAVGLRLDGGRNVPWEEIYKQVWPRHKWVHGQYTARLLARSFIEDQAWDAVMDVATLWGGSDCAPWMQDNSSKKQRFAFHKACSAKLQELLQDKSKKGIKNG